jgi:hypothetical protein
MSISQERLKQIVLENTSEYANLVREAVNWEAVTHELNKEFAKIAAPRTETSDEFPD